MEGQPKERDEGCEKEINRDHKQDPEFFFC